MANECNFSMIIKGTTDQCDLFLAALQQDDVDNVENALYHLKTICQNELNADFYRSLFRVLIDICED